MLNYVVFLWMIVSGGYVFLRHKLWKRRTAISIHSFDKESLLPLRGLMAIMIIFCHLSSKTGGHLDICYSWGEPVVAVFLFISGFGFMKSNMHKDNYLNGFMFKRIKSVLVPYLVCALLYQPIMYCISGTLPILNGGYDISDSLLPTSWYIIAILVYSSLFYMAASLSKNDSMIV